MVQLRGVAFGKVVYLKSYTSSRTILPSLLRPLLVLLSLYDYRSGIWSGAFFSTFPVLKAGMLFQVLTNAWAQIRSKNSVQLELERCFRNQGPHLLNLDIIRYGT